jgi:hypothetical protein
LEEAKARGAEQSNGEAIMADQSADEIKNEAITKMGQALGEQYSALWQEVALLHVNWDEYVELFGTKPTRIELLNQAAPSFFRMIQDELWDTTLLGIARITDPPATAGKANLTVQNLPGLIGDVKTKGVVDELVKTLLKETEFCRDWRNRRIAHRDLNIALAQPAAPLKDASRAQVNSFQSACRCSECGATALSQRGDGL